MSAASPTDAIARRVAARLAPEVGPTLPAYVERVIAEGGAAEDETPQRSVEQAGVAQLAALVVQVITLLWIILRDVRQERQGAQQQAALDDAFLRGLLLSRLGARAQIPPELAARVKDAAINAAIDEVLAEAKQIEAGKR